jgi:hypothetical protein
MGGPAQGLGGPTQGLGGPAQDLGGPTQGLGDPAWEPAGPTQGLGGLGLAGAAAGVAGAGQWQAAPAAPAQAYPQPLPLSGTSGQAVIGGIVAFLGAIATVVACAVPLVKGPSAGGFGGTSISLFSVFSHGSLKWFLAEPIGVAILGVVAGLIIMSSRSRVSPAVAAGVLIGIGLQTVGLFLAIRALVNGLVGLTSGLASGFGAPSVPVAQAGPADIVGLLGGVLLIVAGVVGVAAARRN